eukprot:3241451-Pyramimonas_sp.AAC.1
MTAERSDPSISRAGNQCTSPTASSKGSSGCLLEGGSISREEGTVELAAPPGEADDGYRDVKQEGGRENGETKGTARGK